MRTLLAAKMVIAEFADPQFGDERCVPGEDAEIAVLPRKLHFHDFLAEQLLLRGDDHQFDGVGQHFSFYALAFIFSAFPSASSIVPPIYNACSGMSPYFPSTMSLKLRTVSSIFTYFPSRPVNCAATNMGCERNFSILRARATVRLSSSESSSIPRMAMMSWRSL